MSDMRKVDAASMNAIDKIAELHHLYTGLGQHACYACDRPWPCPTRRLCDEAGEEMRDWKADADQLAAAAHVTLRWLDFNSANYPGMTEEAEILRDVEASTTMLEMMREVERLTADRDRWKADAERLAVVLRSEGHERWEPGNWNGKPICVACDDPWPCSAVATLAAHDALTAETET